MGGGLFFMIAHICYRDDFPILGTRKTLDDTIEEDLCVLGPFYNQEIKEHGLNKIDQAIDRIKNKRLLLIRNSWIYGESKSATEDHEIKYFTYMDEILKDENYTNFIIVRLASLYGPLMFFGRIGDQGSMVDNFCTRNFLYEEDLVKIVPILLNSNKAGIYNLGGPEESTEYILCSHIKQYLDTEVTLIPAQLLPFKENTVSSKKIYKDFRLPKRSSLEEGLTDMLQRYKK